MLNLLLLIKVKREIEPLSYYFITSHTITIFIFLAHKIVFGSQYFDLSFHTKNISNNEHAYLNSSQYIVFLQFLFEISPMSYLAHTLFSKEGLFLQQERDVFS